MLPPEVHALGQAAAGEQGEAHDGMVVRPQGLEERDLLVGAQLAHPLLGLLQPVALPLDRGDRLVPDLRGAHQDRAQDFDGAVDGCRRDRLIATTRLGAALRDQASDDRTVDGGEALRVPDLSLQPGDVALDVGLGLGELANLIPVAAGRPSKIQRLAT